MNYLIIGKLKEIKQMQNDIKLEDLKYATNRGDNYDNLLSTVFLGHIHERNLSLEDADKE